jgi:hypothetical protein
MKHPVMFALLMTASTAFAAEELPAPLAGPGGTVRGASPLDQFATEPSIREVQEAAMRYALVNDDVLNGYQTSAKWTKLLPRTRVRYRQDVDDNTTVSVNEVGERDLTLDDDENTNYEMQLEWRFDEMLMGPTRIQAIRETSRLVQLRDDVLDEATKVFFDRRRVQVDIAMNPPGDPKARAAKDLRLEELTANLDALTGGWFTQRVKAGAQRGNK